MTTEEKTNKFSTEPNMEAIQETAQFNEYLESKQGVWETIKKCPFACVCIIGMIFILMLASFENQAGGIVVSIPEFRKDFGKVLPGGTDYVIETKWQSAFSGIPTATLILGQWTGSWLSDKYGKKWVIFITIIVSCGFVGIEVAATNIRIFLLGKALNGFNLGIIQASSVSYVADITPLPIRGLATALCNISYSLGPLICFIINYFEASKTSRWSYRSILAAQWGFAAVGLLALLIVPESPVYYVVKGDLIKAEKSYSRLMKDPQQVASQIAIITNAIEEAKELSKGYTFIDCFRGRNAFRTMVSSVPFMFCAFSGVVFTASYTTYYFQLAGFGAKKSFLYTIGAQLLSVGGCIASLYVIGTFGRRTTLLWGTAFVGGLNFVIGGTGTVTTPGPVLNTTIAFMMMYGFWYNCGIGGVCFAIASENATAGLRTKTIGIALSMNNTSGMVWGFIIPYIFNPDRANLGAKTMFIYAGSCVLFWIYFYFYVPETANRPIDEIDELYMTKVPLRKFAKTTTQIAIKNEEAFMKVVDDKTKVSHVEDEDDKHSI